MASYKVVLNDEAKTELRITAGDVEVFSDENEPSWFNFLEKLSRDDEHETVRTVAAIPFSNVFYITS